jgi:hypothetical protein
MERTVDAPPDPADVNARTRAWLEQAVIGLNLCPFAKAVHAKGRIRWVVSAATCAEELRVELTEELRLLAATPIDEIETTLLIHPSVLRDFLDYNNFLDAADAEIAEAGLEGVIQVASFHPDYVFAGSSADDVENASNRSPWPLLHLLREESIDRAVAAYPDPDAIVARNLDTLRRLGHEGWRALARGWLKGDSAA